MKGMESLLWSDDSGVPTDEEASEQLRQDRRRHFISQLSRCKKNVACSCLAFLICPLAACLVSRAPWVVLGLQISSALALLAGWGWILEEESTAETKCVYLCLFSHFCSVLSVNFLGNSPEAVCLSEALSSFGAVRAGVLTLALLFSRSNYRFLTKAQVAVWAVVRGFPNAVVLWYRWRGDFSFSFTSLSVLISSCLVYLACGFGIICVSTVVRELRWQSFGALALERITRERAEGAKVSFLTYIMHELRNPLSSAILMLNETQYRISRWELKKMFAHSAASLNLPPSPKSTSSVPARLSPFQKRRQQRDKQTKEATGGSSDAASGGVSRRSSRLRSLSEAPAAAPGGTGPSPSPPLPVSGDGSPITIALKQRTERRRNRAATLTGNSGERGIAEAPQTAVAAAAEEGRTSSIVRIGSAVLYDVPTTTAQGEGTPRRMTLRRSSSRLAIVSLAATAAATSRRLSLFNPEMTGPGEDTLKEGLEAADVVEEMVEEEEQEEEAERQEDAQNLAELKKLTTLIGSQLDQITRICTDVCVVERMDGSDLKFFFRNEDLKEWFASAISSEAPAFEESGVKFSHDLSVVCEGCRKSAEACAESGGGKGETCGNCEVNREAVSSEKLFAFGDFLKLGQALKSLLSNARRYAKANKGEEGQVSIKARLLVLRKESSSKRYGHSAHVACLPDEDDITGWVRLEVDCTDNGSGLSEQDLRHRLFVPYGMSRGFKDMNAGGPASLSASQKSVYIESHADGKISAESEGPGRGATFRFTVDLPIVPPPPDKGDMTLPTFSRQPTPLVLSESERGDVSLGNSAVDTPANQSSTNLAGFYEGLRNRRPVREVSAPASPTSASNLPSPPEEPRGGAFGFERDSPKADRRRASTLLGQKEKSRSSVTIAATVQPGDKKEKEKETSATQPNPQISGRRASTSGRRPSVCSDTGSIIGLSVHTVREFTADVLVVDDNEMCLLGASLALERLGMACCTASDGDEAVRLYENGAAFRLILMDRNMDRMDGDEACKQIMEMSEKDVQIPSPIIVGVTADTSEYGRRAFMTAGAKKIVPKPITHQKVASVLEEFGVIARPERKQEQGWRDPEFL
uniref:Response regulatory domain-containing protein n=1 Tax=Chromera velia CCMP2878 TaxID=1169474 RepID=A0A0G4HPQ7_9ALVE|eukprot:Cvel_7863.t1-p1 / transcript=Cvel_7863.t1 / gene=Cvel_7863 / organism=Chromera_velia_CCMP2878 / gene_product=Two-component response regulator ARR22, putative / transcript_product=Two-component response regulator ARR22, putative / location=Cvel_scaffold421:34928-40824(+) / protein_length=1091 / sequence_SO=supercontig / SO=protein_coding / is_pseudo=false